MPASAGAGAGHSAAGFSVLKDTRCPANGGTITLVAQRLLLASPRGYCAGVERAVDTVLRALELYGAPVYVRRQIVHNTHVVRDLEERGAVFVESEEDVPPGAMLVLSAHGVAPAVHERADARRLRTIDATCPLVTRVHAAVRRHAAAGATVVLVGHAGHDEVEGTLGEAPESTVLVETVDDAERVRIPDPKRVAYVTQTTLSVDETAEIIAVLRRRFPAIEGPDEGDICYATTNRQQAVKELAAEVDLVLVIGSKNSSNSNRLVETAQAAGVEAHLIDDESEIDESWLAGVDTVGLTSGASVPDQLVRRVCDWFRARGTEVPPVAPVLEDVFFRLPVEVRRIVPPLRSAGRFRPVSRLPHVVPHRRRARARHAPAPVSARRPRLVVGLPLSGSSRSPPSRAGHPVRPARLRQLRPARRRLALDARALRLRGAGRAGRARPRPPPPARHLVGRNARAGICPHPARGAREPRPLVHARQRRALDRGDRPAAGRARARRDRGAVQRLRTSAVWIRSRRSWRRGRRSAT